MTRLPETRFWLRLLIIMSAALASLWSASMLVSVFNSSGQLEGLFNPLGDASYYIAAGAITCALTSFQVVIALHGGVMRPIIFLSVVLAASIAVIGGSAPSWANAGFSMRCIIDRIAAGDFDVGLGLLFSSVPGLIQALCAILLLAMRQDQQRGEFIPVPPDYERAPPPACDPVDEVRIRQASPTIH